MTDEELYACLVKSPGRDTPWHFYAIGSCACWDPPERIPLAESREDIIRFARATVGELSDILPIGISPEDVQKLKDENRGPYRISKRDIEIAEKSARDGELILIT